MFLLALYLVPSYSLGFPCGSAGKESACNAGDLSSIPGLGRSPGEGKGYPLQYSGLENFLDCVVHGVAKNRTQLSDFHFVDVFAYIHLMVVLQGLPTRGSHKFSSLGKLLKEELCSFFHVRSERGR